MLSTPGWHRVALRAPHKNGLDAIPGDPCCGLVPQPSPSFAARQSRYSCPVARTFHSRGPLALLAATTEAAAKGRPRAERAAGTHEKPTINVPTDARVGFLKT